MRDDVLCGAEGTVLNKLERSCTVWINGLIVDAAMEDMQEDFFRIDCYYPPSLLPPPRPPPLGHAAAGDTIMPGTVHQRAAPVHFSLPARAYRLSLAPGFVCQVRRLL